ncbi:methylated-DNA--[protein]-cysteine S-methyltransferase [Weissella sagaensis]|uniref:methylated-DNA--[protein]-cysteine S-methyltransferase n=1 Tax=Weissella sagaensis TaxID=2559928 RepID=UPI00214ABAEE|nr:methylated-DNA--[protein]-cysteine S-methyltransferase [Weissella sagaensis]
MQYVQVVNTPLGKITLLSDDEFLLGSWFEGQRHFGSKYDLSSAIFAETPILKQAKKWLSAYFAGEQPDDSGLTIQMNGTIFQKKVLQALRQVPYGQTVTYKHICQMITSDEAQANKLSRAVGNAVSKNPFVLFIPCHRVVGSDGSLTGYAGGIERKRSLLALEQVTF